MCVSVGFLIETKNRLLPECLRMDVDGWLNVRTFRYCVISIFIYYSTPSYLLHSSHSTTASKYVRMYIYMYPNEVFRAFSIYLARFSNNNRIADAIVVAVALVECRVVSGFLYPSEWKHLLGLGRLYFARLFHENHKFTTCHCCQKARVIIVNRFVGFFNLFKCFRHC